MKHTFIKTQFNDPHVLKIKLANKLTPDADFYFYRDNDVYLFGTEVTLDKLCDKTLPKLGLKKPKINPNTWTQTFFTKAICNYVPLELTGDALYTFEIAYDHNYGSTFEPLIDAAKKDTCTWLQQIKKRNMLSFWEKQNLPMVKILFPDNTHLYIISSTELSFAGSIIKL